MTDETLTVADVIAEFRKDEHEALETAQRIEKRLLQGMNFGDDRFLAAHYRKNAKHYGDRANAIAAALQQSSEGNDRLRALEGAAEMLWIVLANVSEGDWHKQSQDWQDAAARWRDNYFEVLALVRPGAALPPESHDAIARRLAAEGTAAFMADDNRPIENVIYKQVLKALAGAALPVPQEPK